jgi:hypothetical protein
MTASGIQKFCQLDQMQSCLTSENVANFEKKRVVCISESEWERAWLVLSQDSTIEH